jgi:hypothetical protein
MIVLELADEVAEYNCAVAGQQPLRCSLPGFAEGALDASTKN